MQIERLSADTPQACLLLSLCVGDSAQRELAEYLENPSAYIAAAYDNGFMCGIVIALFSLDSCDIADIATDACYRRMGVARELIGHITRLCIKRGINCQLLEVRKSNAAAVGFYESQGFEMIAVRKKYYSRPTEDAVVMRRNI